MRSNKNEWIKKAESVTGKARKRFGAMAGDLKEETQGLAGEAQKRARKARRRAARLRFLGRMQGRATSAVGSVKVSYGRRFGKKRYVVAGKAQQLRGQTLQEANR